MPVTGVQTCALPILEEYFREQGYEYRMLKEDTYSIVLEKTEPGQTQCWICSRLRRGILYNAAVELGCNKIALGHHREDLIETLLLNLFFAGSLGSMPPKLRSNDGRNTVIRPLCYAPEKDIAAFAELMKFPIIPCDLCGSQELLQRKQVKAMLQEWEKKQPGRLASIFGALTNVAPSHLLDRSLFDFANIEATGETKPTPIHLVKSKPRT